MYPISKSFSCYRYTELEEENNHFKIVIAKVEEDFNKFTIQKEEEMSHIMYAFFNF